MTTHAQPASDLAASTAKAFEALSLYCLELESKLGPLQKEIDHKAEELSGLLVRAATLHEDSAALSEKNEAVRGEARGEASRLVASASVEAKAMLDGARTLVDNANALVSSKNKEIESLNVSIDQRKAELARITKSAAAAIKALG